MPPKKIVRTGSIDPTTHLSPSTEQGKGADDDVMFPLHNRSKSEPDVTDDFLEELYEADERTEEAPEESDPLPERAKSDPIAIVLSQPPKTASVVSPRFSLLSQLPPPPPPPSDLNKCIQQVSLDTNFSQDIESKRASVTLLVNPVDGQPYRLKPLPTQPLEKPAMPKKRSTVGQNPHHVSALLLRNVDITFFPWFLVSTNLGFSYSDLQKRFEQEVTTAPAESAALAPIKKPLLAAILAAPIPAIPTTPAPLSHIEPAEQAPAALSNPDLEPTVTKAAAKPKPPIPAKPAVVPPKSTNGQKPAIPQKPAITQKPAVPPKSSVPEKTEPVEVTKVEELKVEEPKVDENQGAQMSEPEQQEPTQTTAPTQELNPEPAEQQEAKPEPAQREEVAEEESVTEETPAHELTLEAEATEVPDIPKEEDQKATEDSPTESYIDSVLDDYRDADEHVVETTTTTATTTSSTTTTTEVPSHHPVAARAVHTTKVRSTSIRIKAPQPGEPKPLVGSRSFKLVKAFWDAEPQEGGELSFVTGDIIKILNDEDDEWWLGELEGVQGWLPSSFVMKIAEKYFEEVHTSDQIVEGLLLDPPFLCLASRNFKFSFFFVSFFSFSSAFQRCGITFPATQRNSPSRGEI